MNSFKPWMAVVAGLVILTFIFALKQSSHSIQTPPDLSSVKRAADASMNPRPKPGKLVILDSTNAEASPIMMSAEHALRSFQTGSLALNYVDVTKHASATQALRLQSLPAILFVDALGKELARHEKMMSPEEIQSKCKELGLLPPQKKGEEAGMPVELSPVSQ